MILWFLRLFPQFREMERGMEIINRSLDSINADGQRLREALQAAQTERLILQDRLDAAVEDRSRLWNMTTECISQERTAYHSALNVQWQQRGFGAPYPDAPKLPDSAVRENGGGSVGQTFDPPSRRVAHATSDFIQSLANRNTPKGYGQQ